MKMTKFIPVVFAAIALLGAVPLTACNTVEGVGEDVEEAGDAIEEAGNSGYND